MCPSLAEIRSVTSEIKRRKKDKEERKNKTTAIKYKPSGIAMPCGPQESASQTASRLVQPFFAEYVRVTNRQHALNYVQFPHRQWHIFRKGEGTASKLHVSLTARPISVYWMLNRPNSQLIICHNFSVREFHHALTTYTCEYDTELTHYAIFDSSQRTCSQLGVSESPRVERVELVIT